MIRLQIESFSTIKKADVELAVVNIIIGPQASGKSVISKLAYFFIECVSDQFESVIRGNSFEKFSEEIKDKFSEWFPVSAWGQGKFRIEFQMGAYRMRLARTTYSKGVRDNLRLWTSKVAKQHYEGVTELYAKLQAPKRGQRVMQDRYELRWRLANLTRRRLSETIGPDLIDSQFFIPAGRSFFTNLGRAFLAFDQGRVLDPITVQFGRLYSSYHEEYRYMRVKDRGSRFENSLANILGGEVIWEEERALVACPDGRKIPFSALSSGQQELFPLVVALRAATSLRTEREGGHQLLYIEEPEAHLFPSAQSSLVQGLISMARDGALYRLLMTTHSPYVLAKINNLIKAGALERSLPERKQTTLNRLIPKASRIPLGDAHAYAIIDGEVKSIVDEDGLIAADYLDDVSGQIGDEFSKLLALEVAE